jgi:hypothetical protein
VLLLYLLGAASLAELVFQLLELVHQRAHVIGGRLVHYCYSKRLHVIL